MPLCVVTRKDMSLLCDVIYARLHIHASRERSLLHKIKGKYHVLSTSQKADLTEKYKKFLVMSTTAISKPVSQEVDGTVILPLTFIKE